MKSELQAMMMGIHSRRMGLEYNGEVDNKSLHKVHVKLNIPLFLRTYNQLSFNLDRCPEFES